MNNHYITRGLTRPWEHGDRRLSYFDFTDASVTEASSRSLFAEENLHDEALEQFFKQTIEDPLFSLKDKLNKQIHSIDDWTEFRSFFLFFALQTPRLGLLIDGDEKTESIAILQKFANDKTFLDSVAQEMQNRFLPVVVNLPANKPLYFTETAFFQFAIPRQLTPQDFVHGYGLPLSPMCAILIVPQDSDIDWLRNKTGILEWYSIGVSDYQSKIVIPPSVLINNDHALIAERITSARLKVRETLLNTHKANTLLNQMRAIAGLPPLKS